MADSAHASPKGRLETPRFTIDRFEGGDWAVLEDETGATFTVPRCWLPDDAREGDVLSTSTNDSSGGGKTLHFELDDVGRQQRLTEATRLRDQLPRAPKGDVSL